MNAHATTKVASAEYLAAVPPLKLNEVSLNFPSRQGSYRNRPRTIADKTYADTPMSAAASAVKNVGRSFCERSDIGQKSRLQMCATQRGTARDEKGRTKYENSNTKSSLEKAYVAAHRSIQSNRAEMLSLGMG